MRILIKILRQLIYCLNTIPSPIYSFVKIGGSFFRQNYAYKPDNLAKLSSFFRQNYHIGTGGTKAFILPIWESGIGGNAGKITIKADTITLNGNTQIGTEAISGGGGNITLHVDNMVFLANSQVSTSVQEAVGNEGHGGNINITTTEVYTFPPESARDASQNTSEKRRAYYTWAIILVAYG